MTKDHDEEKLEVLPNLNKWLVELHYAVLEYKKKKHEDAIKKVFGDDD